MKNQGNFIKLSIVTALAIIFSTAASAQSALPYNQLDFTSNQSFIEGVWESKWEIGSTAVVDTVNRETTMCFDSSLDLPWNRGKASWIDGSLTYTVVNRHSGHITQQNYYVYEVVNGIVIVRDINGMMIVLGKYATSYSGNGTLDFIKGNTRSHFTRVAEYCELQD